MELNQVSVFLWKEKKYLVRIRGRNPLPLMEMTALGMPETRNKEASVIKEAGLLEARKK